VKLLTSTSGCLTDEPVDFQTTFRFVHREDVTEQFVLRETSCQKTLLINKNDPTFLGASFKGDFICQAQCRNSKLLLMHCSVPRMFDLRESSFVSVTFYILFHSDSSVSSRIVHLSRGSSSL